MLIPGLLPEKYVGWLPGHMLASAEPEQPVDGRQLFSWPKPIVPLFVAYEPRGCWRRANLAGPILLESSAGDSVAFSRKGAQKVKAQ